MLGNLYVLVLYDMYNITSQKHQKSNYISVETTDFMGSYAHILGL